MESERINIKQFDLWNEKEIVSEYNYLLLADNFLLYAQKFSSVVPVSSDPDDHTQGWKEMRRNFKLKLKRSALVSVDMMFDHKHNVWQLQVEANGYPASLTMYFETGSEANELFKKLDKYIFGI